MLHTRNELRTGTAKTHDTHQGAVGNGRGVEYFRAIGTWCLADQGEAPY